MNLQLLDKYDKLPLTGDQAYVYNTVTRLPLDMADSFVKEALQANESFRILHKRLEIFDVLPHLDVRVLIFVGSLLRHRFEAVLWAYSLMRWVEDGDHHEGTLTWAWFVERFPNRVPSAITMRQAWESQKAADMPNGNYLDSQEAWV